MQNTRQNMANIIDILRNWYGISANKRASIILGLLYLSIFAHISLNRYLLNTRKIKISYSEHTVYIYEQKS